MPFDSSMLLYAYLSIGGFTSELNLGMKGKKKGELSLQLRSLCGVFYFHYQEGGRDGNPSDIQRVCNLWQARRGKLSRAV